MGFYGDVVLRTDDYRNSSSRGYDNDRHGFYFRGNSSRVFYGGDPHQFYIRRNSEISDIHQSLFRIQTILERNFHYCTDDEVVRENPNPWKGEILRDSLRNYAQIITDQYIKTFSPAQDDREYAQFLLGQLAKTTDLQWFDDDYQETLLHNEIRKKQPDLNLIRKLIAQGINLESKNRQGYTALNLAASNEHEEVVRILIAAGANVNTEEELENRSPVYFAVNNTQILTQLIAASADVTKANKHGSTPLEKAISEGETARCLLLIGATKDVNKRLEFNDTYLHQGIIYANVEVIRALLAAGADQKALDCLKRTPLEFAKYLLEQSKKTHPKESHKYQAVIEVLTEARQPE